MKNKNEDDYPDMDGWEEADDEESDDEDEDRGKTAYRSSTQNDINFEKTLEQYDENDFGYLDEVNCYVILFWHFLYVCTNMCSVLFLYCLY